MKCLGTSNFKNFAFQLQHKFELINYNLYKLSLVFRFSLIYEYLLKTNNIQKGFGFLQKCLYILVCENITAIFVDPTVDSIKI